MLLEFNKRIMKILILVFTISSFIFYSSAIAEEVLKMGGVGSVLGSMKLVAEAFEKSNPGIKVQILPSLGSTGGIKAVSNGAIDIGLSGRHLKEDERRQGSVEIEYAKSPLVFVTNKNNKVSGLSIRELVEIYEGKRQNWPDGTRIRLVLRPASDVDTSIIENISPEMSKAVKNALSRPGMIVAITNQESDAVVEKTPGSLGASTLTQVISEKRSLKMLSFNGVAPSVNNLTQGSYPLFKPFFIVTKPNPSASVQKFIDFVRSREGRKILEQTGNVVITSTSGQ